MPEPRCAPEMVRVDARRTPAEVAAGAARAGITRPFCVDRWEAVLVEAAAGRLLSPHYPPSRKLALKIRREWEIERLAVGDAAARAMPLPPLEPWQAEGTGEIVVRAASRRGALPNGYVSGVAARAACREAGKRLCTEAEWRLACGGEQGWKYPYGPAYEALACNVFRGAHPAMVLHENPSIGHFDPRLNLVKAGGKPLLRKTGETARCASRWEDDAVMDMVGNLDEWIDEAGGSFMGGFYARATREGCAWKSVVHPPGYADYSTGVRCCGDLP
jgi:hypothetical protein